MKPHVTITRTLAELVGRPYVRRELPGWGHVYSTLIGGYQRDWLWAEAGVRVVRGKLHGYLMTLDLARWSDRLAFFLGRWYDLETQLLLRSMVKPGDVVIDIGANRGMFMLIAAHSVGASGKVICFEPNPRCVEVLLADVARNRLTNVDVRPVALGETSARLTLSIPTVNSGEATLGVSKYADSETIDCQCEVGDSELAAVYPAFIKIDAEGYECGVIGGLRQTLRRARPIVITEVAKRHMMLCGTSAEQLFGLMADANYTGYRVTLRVRNGRQEVGLAPIPCDMEEFDVVWLPGEVVAQYTEMMV